MRCPKCQNENREGAVFCGRCGERLSTVCPECNCDNPPENSFCDKCGHNLQEVKENPVPDHDQSYSYESLNDSAPTTPSRIEGERRYVTVLFSDMSGYTTMSERLDPEEVKEITSKIFDDISKIITKYDGFVEKFAGDAVMALFGATEAHEDDPVRAIKAAREIHNRVKSLSPQYEERIKKPLVMHSGINTGLVITGDINLEKGTHGVVGETINVAARLSEMGIADDILVGQDTYYQSEGYFDFEELEPAVVKGKSDPIRIYKVTTQKEQPIKIHRLHGFQSNLIGRKVEMAQLLDAARRIKEGGGAVFSIYGPAGTGKSRLLEEFKNSLNLTEIQWLEGHAYPHTQNITYFPLIDLLNRSLQIEEGDPPERVKEKIESGIFSLVGENTDFIPYIGSLYSLSYPEIDEISPAFWKDQLQKAIQKILSSLAQRGPTIIRLEDLHWADPSFLELIRLLLSDSRDPILFLCVYRPIISLFTNHQIGAMTHPYQEIRLQDLSTSESQGMVQSLLQTDAIPPELQRFLQDKVEGNPFYIEEVINSLIESDILVRDNGKWTLSKSITEVEISSTIHGVISGRLDRLEKESKRILQEASVIGRAFFYEILNRITELGQQIDHSLRSLERLDLIRARALQPDLEYIFKHALTQEVVYNGLLKKERRVIHERIGLAMERLFHDRLAEFYETLAYHFQQGQSKIKAVRYLMRAGEKSLKRYAVEEAHQYYHKAFDLLKNKPDKDRKDDLLLIDLILDWALVFYYRAACEELENLLQDHVNLAEGLAENEKLGMYFAWLGLSAYFREKYKDSYEYLHKAIQIGEAIGNSKIIGYACGWITWTCSEMGLLDEAISHGQRAQEISNTLESDHYLFFKSLGGLAMAYNYRGEINKLYNAGKKLLGYGQKHSNFRSIFLGYQALTWGYFNTGDLPTAKEFAIKAENISVDPIYSMGGILNLGLIYAFGGELQSVEEKIVKMVTFSENNGYDVWGSPAKALHGAIYMEKGQMNHGLKIIEAVQESFRKNGRKFMLSLSEYILGKIYLQIGAGAGSASPMIVAKNIGFLVRNVPTAAKKAERHFKKAIQIAGEIGAKNYMAMVYLDLGHLHKAKKRTDQAKECFAKAIALFRQCEAQDYFKQAKEALDSLG